MTTENEGQERFSEIGAEPPVTPAAPVQGTYAQPVQDAPAQEPAPDGPAQSGPVGAQPAPEMPVPPVYGTYAQPAQGAPGAYSVPGEGVYAQPAAPASGPEELIPASRAARRTRRAVFISVGATLLACLTVFAVWRLLSGLRVQVETWTSEDRPQFSIPGGPEIEIDPILPGSADDYEDFRDYFASVYTNPVEDDMPRAATGTGVTLPLEQTAGPELDLQEIYDRVSPAVVGIMTYRHGEKYGWGTGVLFTQDGYLITNAHVVQGASAVTVSLTDGRTLDAALVGSDSTSDIAVLKIEGAGFPTAVFGDSEQLRVGDLAVAIGNPLGEEYAGTMTNGIISGLDRNLVRDGHKVTMIQTNAAINEGNSGGALVNVHGQVIGITNMKIMSTYFATVEGVGFAIPSTVVKQVADQLIAGGVVSGEPTIGITAAAVSDEAQARYDLPAGVYVSEVSEGSDAYEKGLLAGDIILKVNGTDVASVADINVIKETFTIGDTLTLTVYREGEVFDLDIVLVDKTDLR